VVIDSIGFKIIMFYSLYRTHRIENKIC